MVKETIKGGIRFCPRCRNIMILVKEGNRNFWRCQNCGYIEKAISLRPNKCPKCGQPLIIKVSHNLRFKYCPNCGYINSRLIRSNKHLPVDANEVCKWLKEELDIARKSRRVLGRGEILGQWSEGFGFKVEMEVEIKAKYAKSLLPGDAVFIGRKLGVILESSLKVRGKDKKYARGTLVALVKKPFSGKEYFISITEPTILYEAALEIMGCKETASEDEDNTENKKPRPSCTLHGVVTHARKCVRKCKVKVYKIDDSWIRIALCGICGGKNHGSNENEEKPCFYIHLLPEPDRNYESYTKIKERGIKLDDDQRGAIDSIINLWLSPLYFTIFRNEIRVNEQQIVPPGFLVIEGPPGTGKTTVIAVAACALARAGYKVLITSHTNVAIDNALERIMDLCPDLKKGNLIARLGYWAKISKKVMRVLAQPGPKQSMSDFLHYVFSTKRIVGMTIAELAVLHEVYGLENLAKNKLGRWPLFDYVFIDEASMVPLGIAIIPIHYGLRRVILGDTRQLPPITKSQQPTRAAGSVLQLLVDDGRVPIVKLRTQRRGVEGIFDYISEAFYQGELKTESSIEPICFKEAKYGDAIDKALIGDGVNICNQDGQKRKPIIWIDVGGITEWIRMEGKYETSSAINRDEACRAVAIYMRLREYGVGKDEIAIISTYRAQSALIEKAIENLGLEKPVTAYLVAASRDKDLKEIIDAKGIESLLDLRVSKTVDSYQGREKDIIIYSMTADRYHRALENYARFNVAISRAKRMLIILSSMGENDLRELPWIHGLTKTVHTHRVRIDKDAAGNNDICRIINEVANVLKMLSSTR
jgi:ssDNA-binding Zn-finger/Zn-ribbon topoisomerase 1